MAYLLGSIPFGYLVVRFFKKEDIRSVGSGNIGATNVARSGSKGLALLTLALDALKGFTVVYLATLIARQAAPGIASNASPLAITAAVVCVLANVFPVWLRFKGGKGIATALGAFLALVPLVALSSLALFIVIVLATRYVSLGSIAAAVSIPLFTLLLVPHHTAALLLGESAISLVTIARHRANIGRLLHGTESRFGANAKASA
jgi:glycerol-3-phosphate acyltransferase PlsY